jgi:WD40 repeat protein
VKVSTITNQNWDCPAHRGKIVASNNQYLSYVLEGRSGYVLRLIRHGSGRALLKGFVGAIVDVAFCSPTSNLLACIDQGGNLYIWDLDKLKDVSQMQV